MQQITCWEHEEWLHGELINLSRDMRNNKKLWMQQMYREWQKECKKSGINKQWNKVDEKNGNTGMQNTPQQQCNWHISEYQWNAGWVYSRRLTRAFTLTALQRIIYLCKGVLSYERLCKRCFWSSEARHSYKIQHSQEIRPNSTGKLQHGATKQDATIPCVRLTL